MFSENVTNAMGVRTSLQVSEMGNISGYPFNPGFNFLLKASEDGDVTIKLVNSNEEIITTLSEGWNPEICKEVVSSTITLQYGR